jgi:hypothetical protein
MSFIDQPAAQPSSIPYINDNYLADEQTIVRELAAKADPGEATRRKIVDTAAQLVRAVRKNTKNDGGIEAFLKTYDLSSDEGVLLMCVAGSCGYQRFLVRECLDLGPDAHGQDPDDGRDRDGQPDTDARQTG